ncbi:hypothetical protein CFC21_069453, partial [Triticum aestivum]
VQDPHGWRRPPDRIQLWAEHGACISESEEDDPVTF